MFCQGLLDTAAYKVYKHLCDIAAALFFFFFFYHRAETCANDTDSTASSANACQIFKIKNKIKIIPDSNAG